MSDPFKARWAVPLLVGVNHQGRAPGQTFLDCFQPAHVLMVVRLTHLDFDATNDRASANSTGSSPAGGPSEWIWCDIEHFFGCGNGQATAKSPVDAELTSLVEVGAIEIGCHRLQREHKRLKA